MTNDLLVPQALADLDSTDLSLRIDALHRLRPHKDSQIAPKVIPLLRDDNVLIRRLAAEVLGKNGDKGVVAALIKALYDPDADVREAAADALGLIGDRSAVSALSDVLYDDVINVRFAATEALGILGDPRSVVDLIRILDSDDIPLSAMAAMALRKIGTPEALASIQHLWDGDHYIFEVSSNSDVTLPHIPKPENWPKSLQEAQEQHQAEEPPSASTSAPNDAPAEAPAEPVDALADDDDWFSQIEAEADRSEPEASPDEASEDANLEETVRSIPHDLFQSYLEDEGEDQPQAETERGGLNDHLKEEAEASPIEPPAAEAAAPVTPAEPVQFSAYAPREIVPNAWQPLRAYIFKQSAAAAVSADAKQELGDKFGDYRQVERPSTTHIAEGALITATPILDGFQFNPPSAQAAFYDAFERFDFKLRAMTAPLDQASNGHITFSVEGIIVADVPLSIYVSETIPGATSVTVPTTRPIYQAIFCSYSRQDSQIVEHIERAYKALGLDFLRDLETLKSGQDWAVELPRLIEKADIFQLFWSQAAAQSAAVRKEWTYALSLNRQNGAFIRPVYWQMPMPPPPPELGAINFAYQPDLDK